MQLLELKLAISVCVGDFELVVRPSSFKQGWELITDSCLVLDPPSPLGGYLGCGLFRPQMHSGASNMYDAYSATPGAPNT